jgi:hypothetical protein
MTGIPKFFDAQHCMLLSAVIGVASAVIGGSKAL